MTDSTHLTEPPTPTATRLGRLVERVLGAFETHPLLSRLTRLVLPPREEDGQPTDALLGSRLTIRLLALLLGALLLWSLLFTLDIASHSTGEVTTAGQTKLVQHLEGGIVRRILVREGQAVKAGEPLVEVERTAAESDMRELDAQLGALQIKALRLEAQLTRKSDFKVPADLAKRFPDQVETARALLLAQKSRVGSSYEAQSQKISQRSAEQAELQARRAHTEGKLRLLRQQIEINQKLLAEGLANRYEHLNLLKEEELARGTLKEIDASLRRVAAAQKQEDASLRSLDSGDSEQFQKDLAETRRQIAELTERRQKFTDSQGRLTVRSPIDGVVMTLQVVTEGGVVQPGGTLMTLVPANEPLLVEARLPVGDIGVVRVGQEARIQLVSSVARGFQPINGKVVLISPDSMLDDQKIPHYRVRIAPTEMAFTHRGTRYPLIPGVPVSVAILTGHRTLFSYLAGPIVDGLNLTFSEP